MMNSSLSSSPSTSTAPRTLRTSTARATQRTVFLVDDNPQFRTSAQWWLSGAGYDVREFDDPESALSALCELADTQPEKLRRACLLLDVRMPGMSGLDLHDRLSDIGITLHSDARHGGADPFRALLPVVYMTGHGDVPLAVSAMQKGAITLLEKPFADNALEAALDRAFAHAESAWARAQMQSMPGIAPPNANSAPTPGPGAVGECLLPPPPGREDDPVGAKHLFSEDGLAPALPPGRVEYLRRLASLSPRQREVFDGIVKGKLSKQIAYDCGLSAKTVEFHRKAVMVKLQARNAMELLRMAVSRSVDVIETQGEGEKV